MSKHSNMFKEQGKGVKGKECAFPMPYCKFSVHVLPVLFIHSPQPTISAHLPRVTTEILGGVKQFV